MYKISASQIKARMVAEILIGVHGVEAHYIAAFYLIYVGYPLIRLVIALLIGRALEGYARAVFKSIER